MKKLIFLFLSIFIIVGCDNQEEIVKNEYITIKNNLLKQQEYTSLEELPLDITIHIDREDEEVIDYEVVLEHPKENMYSIKALVIHNYYTEGVFPSIGLFDDEKKSLLQEEKTDDTISLSDKIETTKDISKLNLELKLWIEYQNEVGETKTIYYRAIF